MNKPLFRFYFPFGNKKTVSIIDGDGTCYVKTWGLWWLGLWMRMDVAEKDYRDNIGLRWLLWYGDEFEKLQDN